MKKYVLTILFFIGCFFLSVSRGNEVNAAVIGANIREDAYDSRKVTLELTGLAARTTKIIIREVEYCELEVDEDCNSHEIDFPSSGSLASGTAQTVNLKILSSREYQIEMGNNSATLDYEITSEGDGEKYLLVQSYTTVANSDVVLEAYDGLFSYRLSTLRQRIVINPDGNGNPMHVYDTIQYSSVRKVDIKIDLLEEELTMYSGIAYVCEVVNENNTYCGDYLISEGNLNYYLSSYGDGLKAINIYLPRYGETINATSGADLTSELDSKALLISRNLYLDTIGPEITIEGGNWQFVAKGQTYVAKSATCKDAVFGDDECVVNNDSDVVRIDYTSDKYQIITYQASDRLGNVNSVTLRVKVDLGKTNSSGLTIYFIIAGAVLLLTAIILGYFLIKSHEKKKKMSYI